MADTVLRIDGSAFSLCKCLVFIKLSRNLEYIGVAAFDECESLTSLFIPPSCREIGEYAFSRCDRLIILQVPQQTFVRSKWIINSSRLVDRSPFELKIHYGALVHKVYYKQESIFLRMVWPKSVTDVEVHDWIKSINRQEEYAIHRECASCEPSIVSIIQILKDRGIKTLYSENKIGVTPSKYLTENPFHEINEQKIINAYIFDLMGETLNGFGRGTSKAADDDAIVVEGTRKDLLHVESVETNTNRIKLSLDEQMSRQARWKSNYMFLRIKKRENDRIVKVIKTSLDEEKH